MTGVLTRYYQENRRLLTALALVLVCNVGFYVLFAAPAKLRTALLRGQVTAAREQSQKELAEYGRALLEDALAQSVIERVDTLGREVLQTRRERFARVDQRFKQIAAKFKLESHTYNYAYTDLMTERLERQNVVFTLKGSYDILRRFVAEIEQARDEDGRDLFFTIEGIQLADSADSGSELNLTIAVATYYHKPELAEIERIRGVAR